MTTQAEVAKAYAAYKAAKDDLDGLNKKAALKLAHEPVDALDRLCIEAQQRLEEAQFAYDAAVQSAMRN